MALSRFIWPSPTNFRVREAMNRTGRTRLMHSRLLLTLFDRHCSESAKASLDSLKLDIAADWLPRVMCYVLCEFSGRIKI